MAPPKMMIPGMYKQPFKGTKQQHAPNTENIKTNLIAEQPKEEINGNLN